MEIILLKLFAMSGPAAGASGADRKYFQLPAGIGIIKFFSDDGVRRGLPRKTNVFRCARGFFP
jgi:hypothetical protein